MKRLLNEVVPWLIVFFIVVLTFWVIQWIKHFFNPWLSECKQTDVYTALEWSECKENWKKTRVVIKNENPKCINPLDIDKPKEKEECIYIKKCTESSWKIWDWWLCENWYKVRDIEKKEICELWDNSPNRKIKCKEQYVYLFNEQKNKTHTTITEKIDDTKPLIYSNKNNNNLTITSSWQIKSAKLIVKARTSVFGWKIINIPEYYYLLFSISNNRWGIPRVIWTSRIKDNWVDMSDFWVFQWTDTPKTLKFDNLSSLKTAYPKWKVWSEIINYLDIINKSQWKEIYMTLYIWDWDSMIEKNEMKRIFWTIYEAYIEYECKDNSKCSIERIPNLDIGK